MLQEIIGQLRHFFVAEGSDVGRFAAEAWHEGETVTRGAVDAEQNRGNKIAATARCERGVMKQARKIAVARAFRPDAVAARAVCGEQFRDAAGQRVIGTSAVDAAKLRDLGEGLALRELRLCSASLIAGTLRT